MKVILLKKCSGLTNVTIPNSVTSIGSYAFEDCVNLENFYVSWSKPISIDEGVFDKDKISNKILISLYVPQGKTKIYENAGVWQDFYDIQEWDPSTPPTPELEGDVNHDGVVDVADITRVASIILTGKAKEEEDLEEEW